MTTLTPSQGTYKSAQALPMRAGDAGGQETVASKSFLPPAGAMRGRQSMMTTPHRPTTALDLNAASSRLRSPLHSDCAVGREIRELRRARMMTQKELATMVGVTGAQLHRYETGATRIAASRLIAIADALEVGPERLIGAASDGNGSQAPGSHHGGDDILDLIQIFSGISDPKCRAAIMTVVRMLATQQLTQGCDPVAAG